MLFIQKIFSYLFGKKNQADTSIPSKKLGLTSVNNTILRCHLTVDNTEKIKVSFDWPNNINESNLEEISYISSYFLFLLNNGFLKDEILGSLKNSHNPTDALMYQNILFHSRLIELEAKSIIESKNSSEPLIKPSAVFSRRQ